MGSRRGLMGYEGANLNILLQETNQALAQPCHSKTPRKLPGVDILDCVNMLFKQESMRELDASSMSAVNEVCDTSFVESGDAFEDMLPDGEPLLRG